MAPLPTSHLAPTAKCWLPQTERALTPEADNPWDLMCSQLNSSIHRTDTVRDPKTPLAPPPPTGTQSPCHQHTDIHAQTHHPSKPVMLSSTNISSSAFSPTTTQAA